jgi:hypothetical protein
MPFVPYFNIKSWETWSFTEVPDCSQIHTPNIIWVQNGFHDELTRDAPFPDPSFMCLSKFPENKVPSGSPSGPLTGRFARFQSLPAIGLIQIHFY